MEQNVKILLIEDSPLFVQLTRSMLAAAKSVTFELECATDLAGGIKRLSEGGIDAVLLDLTLPDSNGLETFSRLQQGAADVPTVIYTSVDDEELSLSALNHGAADYLVKSEVNANWLARSLIYAIQRKAAPATESNGESDSASTSQLIHAEQSGTSEKAWVAKVSDKRLVSANVLEQLKACLLSLLQRTDCEEVGLDMSEVEYISNAAISMLLIVHKRSTAAGKQMVLHALKPQVHDQLRSRRFDRLFDLRVG